MKIVYSVILLALIPALVLGQSKVRERDLIGEWKMVIDIDRDEIHDEIEEGSEEFERLAEIIAEAAVDFAADIIDEIDIRFRFMDDHRVRIDIEAFGTHEVEYGEWTINRHGELIIEGNDNDHVQVHDAEIWLKEDELLMAFDKDNDHLTYQNIYLIRMDRD